MSFGFTNYEIVNGTNEFMCVLVRVIKSGSYAVKTNARISIRCNLLARDAGGSSLWYGCLIIVSFISIQFSLSVGRFGVTHEF